MVIYRIKTGRSKVGHIHDGRDEDAQSRRPSRYILETYKLRPHAASGNHTVHMQEIAIFIRVAYFWFSVLMIKAFVRRLSWIHAKRST